MVLEMGWNKDKGVLYTGSVDTTARSWMTEIGSEAKTFRGPTRSVGALLVKGKICKKDQE